MNLIRMVRSAAPEANFVAGVSLVLLITKILVLNRYPAKIVGVYEFGVTFESTLSSVIASYVFYLLVVHFKEVTDRAAVAPYVNKHVQRVVFDCKHQLSAFHTASKVALSLDTVTLAEVTEAFSQIAPFAPAPMTFMPEHSEANWLQYFEYYMAKTKRGITRIFAQLPYIDAKLVGLLTSIDDCTHFEGLELIGSEVPVVNADLSVWAPSFYEYCEQCRDLQRFIGEAAE